MKQKWNVLLKRLEKCVSNTYFQMFRIVPRVRQREKEKRTNRNDERRVFCRKWRQRLQNTARLTLSSTATHTRVCITKRTTTPLGATHHILTTPTRCVFVFVCVCAVRYGGVPLVRAYVSRLIRTKHISLSASKYVHSTFAHFVFTARFFFLSSLYFISPSLFALRNFSFRLASSRSTLFHIQNI